MATRFLKHPFSAEQNPKLSTFQACGWRILNKKFYDNEFSESQEKPCQYLKQGGNQNKIRN